jgi:Mrp family chromosome partitioning ATPase
MDLTTANQPRLADYLRPLLTRKWLILIAVIVVTGGVYAFYVRKPNVYTTSTLVFIQDPGDPVQGTPSPASTDRTVQNEATLLYSRATAAAVKQKIGYAGSVSALLAQVSLTSKPGEDFVVVATTGSTATQAADIANAYAQEFVQIANATVQRRIAQAIKLTKTQLAQLAGGAATGVQRANLLDQLNRLELAYGVPTTVGQQVNPAQPPAAPSSPKPTRDAMFAFVISLVASIAAAFGLERFDRRLRNPDEFEAAYAAPMLAVIPHTEDPAPVRAGLPALGRNLREPFRVLRTNIELASLDNPPRTIAISSAMPQEGKSTVVRNLALAFREAGKRVAVVDLDLRHPSLGAKFGVSAARGATDVLRHEVALDDVTCEVGVGVSAFDALLQAKARAGALRAGDDGFGNGNGNGNGHHATTPIPARPNGDGQGPAITLLLSGERPANAPAVLASERVIEVLNELRDSHDVVLIDTAPVLPVTDTVPLLRYADATLFVGRLGATTRDTAKRLHEFLERVPDLKLLGIVANDMSRLEATGYGYGYGYGYGTAPPADGGDEPAAAKRRPSLRRPKQAV